MREKGEPLRRGGRRNLRQGPSLEAELVTARWICFVPTFANGRDCWKIVTMTLLKITEL